MAETEESKRWRDLLEKAAAALEDGIDPFSSHFLCENEVTADECFRMSTTMSVALRALVRATGQTKQEILLLGAIDDPKIRESAVLSSRSQAARSRLNKLVKNL